MSALPLKSSAPAPDAAYLEQALARLPQVLSLIDREALSRTYGSFDRTFWCWKFTDFPASRFQEGIYTLAWLYSHETPGNPLYNHPLCLEWIRAGFERWTKIQRRNGGFDEAYPYENSFAATAFTCFYLGEAWMLVHQHLPVPDRETILHAFSKAGEWFINNDETHGILSNHLAVAVAALYNISRATGEAQFKDRAAFFLERIYRHQSPEGWYEEYGGADPGYQTHGMFYLARVWQMTSDLKLQDSLRRASDFIEATLNPDNTIGGEYASRNTAFYFPAAFEMLAAAIPSAARIARRMQHNNAVGLSAMDGWNLFPMLNNYLFATDAASRNAALAIPPTPAPGGPEETHWHDAGWLIRRTSRYQAIFSLSKGGVIQVWQDGKLLFSDCGYWIKNGKGQAASSQSLQRMPAWHHKDNSYTLETPFVQVNQRVMNPFLFLGFRGFSITLGQWPTAAVWLKNLLVDVLVKRRKSVPIILTRKVIFRPDGIDIEDKIIPTSPIDIKEFGYGSRFSTIHMGSSRYFQINELLLEKNAVKDDSAAEQLSKGQPVTVKRTWQAKT